MRFRYLRPSRQRFLAIACLSMFAVLALVAASNAPVTAAMH